MHAKCQYGWTEDNIEKARNDHDLAEMDFRIYSKQEKVVERPNAVKPTSFEHTKPTSRRVKLEELEVRKAKLEALHYITGRLLIADC